MRILTFAEFFAEPDGAIFGQETGLPHRESGVYRKVASHPEDQDGAASIEYLELVDVHVTLGSRNWVRADEVEDGHRFHVYERSDILRLLAWLTTADMD